MHSCVAFRCLFRMLLPAIGVLLLTVSASAQLNEHCTVSVLNRTAQVNETGFWRIDNIPANSGVIRARAVCVENGLTRIGVSEWFSVPANGIAFRNEIIFESAPPVPAKLTLTATSASMGGIGDTMQLSAVVTLPDGSNVAVPRAVEGTTYTTSNPRVLTVSPDGLVTATGFGVSIVSATNEGALGLLRIGVTPGALDGDRDGMPDEWERTYGLNPNDPGDAIGDADGDGLTNLREFELDTNPIVRDSDGDGISDGLEVEDGTDPLDPSSLDLEAALQSIRVTPSPLDIAVNTILGEGSRLVTVTGTLRDASTIDLTSRARGTNYTPSNAFVISLGPVDGEIFGGAAGTATLTVENSGKVAVVPVTVRTFSPRLLSFLAINGTDAVSVQGNYAFIGTFNAEMKVVDITDRSAPRIVANYLTPDDARDVVVRGNIAYLAVATGGLEIVDVSVPTQPVRRSLFALPGGQASDVELFDLPSGQRLAHVTGGFGLKTVDVTNPAAPVVISTLPIPNAFVRMFARNATTGVLAGSTSGIIVIDVTNPTQPRITATLDTARANGVRVVGTTAYVADSNGGLLTVDISDPAAPTILDATDTNASGMPSDVSLHGSLAFLGDDFFQNALPIVDVADPTNLIVQTVINPLNFNFESCEAIESDARYVYRAAFRGFYIIQYVDFPAFDQQPPTIRITSPANGSNVLEGQRLRVTFDPRDDAAISFGRVLVNGLEVGRDSVVPYEIFVNVPAGNTTMTIRAIATDVAGNDSAPAEAQLNVLPDVEAPAVTMQQPIAGQTVVEGTNLRITATATDNARVSRLEALVDGNAVGAATTNSLTFDYFVPRGAIGTINVAARAFDPSGNTTTTPSRAVTVLPDRPPVITLTSPGPNHTLLPEGEVAVTASITDDVLLGNSRLVANGQIRHGVHFSDVLIPPSEYLAAYRLPAGVTSATYHFEADDSIGQTGFSETRSMSVTPTSALGSVAINGFGNDVEVAGNYAFVAAGAAGLEVFDVSNPVAPVRVAGLDTPGLASSLETAGGIVYLADGSGGLRIIDVSNPLQPVTISSLMLPADVFEVLLDGARLFAGGPQGVHSVDVKSAIEPLLINTHYTYGPVVGMARVNGVLAVLYDNPRDLRQDINKTFVLDIVAFSGAPRRVGQRIFSAQRTHFGFGIAAKGTTLYLARQQGLHTLDLSNPTNPLLIGSNFRYDPLRLRDLTIVGDRLIASRHGDRSAASVFELEPRIYSPLAGIVDFSAVGTHRGTSATATPDLLFTTAATSIIDGKAATGTTRLFIGRLATFSDTAAIPPAATIDMPHAGTAAVSGETVMIEASATDDIAVARVDFSIDGILLFSDNTPPYRYSYRVPVGSGDFTVSVQAFDYAGNISVPASVVVSAGADTIAPTVALTSPRRGESIPGNVLVLRADARDNFRTAEVRFLVNGVVVHTDTEAPFDFAYGIPAGTISLRAGAEAVDRAGTVGSADEITVSVIAPRLLGSVVVPGYANAVDMNGNYVYVAAGQAGLHVYDITNPASPARIATLDTPGIAADVSILGNYAFVGDADIQSPSGYHIVDIRNPAAPVLVKTTAFASRYIAAVQRGFLVANSNNIQSVSAETPLSPRTTSFLNVNEAQPQGIDAAGWIRYWTQNFSSELGLLCFRDLNPGADDVAGGTSEVAFAGGSPMGVVVRNNVAAMATNAGLATTDTRILNEYRSTSASGPALREVDLYGEWVFGARRDAVNSTSIYNVADPFRPFFAGSIDFTDFPAYQQTDLVVSPSRLVVTGVVGGSARPGITGDSRLFIAEPFVFDDNAGVAPAVTLLMPVSARAGELFALSAEASDDVAVQSVTFYVNGQAVFEDTSAPYEYNHLPPAGATQVTVQARARDFAGNSAQSAVATLAVNP
jgi:hypothetical protein